MNQDVSPFSNYCLVKSFTIVYVILACIEMTLYGELLRILASVNLGKSKNFMKQGLLGKMLLLQFTCDQNAEKLFVQGHLLCWQMWDLHNLSDNKLPKWMSGH